MRRVRLESAAPAKGAAEVFHVQKLTGHLWARLMELEEDGLRVLFPTDPREGAGVVLADLPGGDTEALVRELRDRWQVLCRWENGAARFELGPDTTFEELDYVQDAVYRLLLRRTEAPGKNQE